MTDRHGYPPARRGDAGAVRWLPFVSPTAALATGALAAVALLGWIAGSPILRGVVPGLVPMNPLTAAAFLLAAAALWLLGAQHNESVRVGRVLGAAAGVLGTLKLGEYVFGWQIGLDQLLFRIQLDAMSPPNRMAPNTAACFALSGLSLLLVGTHFRQSIRPATLAVLPVALLASLALVGYGYRTTALIGVAGTIPMALNTAVGFLLLSAGVLAARPIRGPLGVALSDSRAGAAARRLLAAAFLVPVVLGWLRLYGQDRGAYDVHTGTALFALTTVVLFAALVLRNAAIAHEADAAEARVQTALRESERQLFQILEAVPVGIFVVDGRGRPYYANHMSQQLLGKGIMADRTLDQLPEAYQAYRTGTDTLYPADRQPIVLALGGEHAYADDLEVRRPDRRVPIEVWASPVHDSDGRVAFAIAAFSDMTDRLRARQEIEQLNAELAQQVEELDAVNRELETFSYSVSHDLRAPLRAVDGFSRILLEDHGAALGEEARRLLGVVRANAQRMGRLIDDLLKFSRLSRKDLETAPVDMTAIVRAVAAEVRAREAGRTMDVQIGELPPAVGDAALLRQVWANLIGNAIKYSSTREHARVDIGGRPEGDECLYYVRDNGVGFDMKYVDKVFAVFQRLHRQDEFEGTGVGLPIVQRIVHRHGGRVWAEAESGRGATFWFTLPTATREPQ